MNALWATVTFVTAGTLWYLWQVYRGATQAILASWIIISTTMTLGWISYWCSPVHSLTGNIGNLTGVASTISIFAAVLIKELLRGDAGIVFSPIQKKCLRLAGVIMLIWAMLRFVVGNEMAALVSNILTQALMVIGFWPMFHKLKNATATSEPAFTWLMITLSCVIALFTSDGLGTLYAVRGAACAGLVAWFVIRIRYRRKT